MEKTYNPHTIEQEWYNRWEQAGYFKPSNQGPSYCIMLPPPNVTGSLHMGHGFQHSLMDALIRYHRMCGHNTLWQGGVDHAGIATQIVVERQLEAENKSRHTLGRPAFEERIWQWKAESGSNISRQLRRMGSSLDWSRECFTMDANFSKAVQTAFIQLHREGLIYRGKRLVNWDPKLQSAVSDLEVLSSEEVGQLWYIRYPLADQSGHLVVATTRPETMFGDVAVAVHPTDDRYQALIGKQLRLPFTERTIPIIADEGVDPEFGTGCVKITPAHDFNDYAMGQRHQLPQINIFTPIATLNDNTPTAYRGLDRFEARKKVIEDLTTLGSIEKITPHMLAVPRCERTGQVIEPYLTDQWYVNMKTLAQPAITAVEKGELRFIPENWTKTYLQWLCNIEDWCISRQLWWGHRIPAWYDETGNIYIGTDEEQIRQEYKLEEAVKLKQDEDVLDTWFSSALWPFATLGWPEKTPELSAFYPTNVLVTGFDIIFFWVARMVMFGLHFTKQVPFKEVYITGLIRDQYGQKMSKSKGNVLDPIDLIDGIHLDDLIKKRTYGLLQPAMAKQIAENTHQQFPEGIPAFGTDALRFTFCALANTGRDIRFDLNRVAGYRNFCNKLWNATRFVLMHTETQGETFLTSPRKLNISDQWIYSRLQHTIQEVHSHFSNYRFDLLAQTIYDFVWGDYCDWYVELAKVTLHNEHASEVLKNGTRFTLLDVLENILRLAHPLMPYITEEIWQRIALLLNKHFASIQLQAYPVVDTTVIYPDAENAVNWLQQIVMAIRNIRSEMQISPSKKLPLLIRNANKQDLRFFDLLELEISQLAKLSSIKEVQENPPPAATALVGKLELLIPLSDAIDTKAEIARLNKEIEKLNTNLDKAEQKLANEDYIAKAPPLVVSKEKEKAAELRLQCEKLRHQLQQIQLSNR